MGNKFVKTRLALALCAAACVLPSLARANGRYLNVTLQGAFEKQRAKEYTLRRESYGLELGIPITWFFEIELGHNVTMQTRTYTQAGIDALNEQIAEAGISGKLEGPLEDKVQQLGTTVNGSIGYPIGAVYPYIFGGKLWRTVQQRSIFYISAPQKDETWNAGVGMASALGAGMKLKVSYRLSPSVLEPKKTFDTLLSLGLTWGI